MIFKDHWCSDCEMHILGKVYRTDLHPDWEESWKEEIIKAQDKHICYGKNSGDISGAGWDASRG